MLSSIEFKEVGKKSIRRGKILWIDSRASKFEGQILEDNGTSWYFNYSTWNGTLSPLKNQAVKFKVDSNGVWSSCDLLSVFKD